jgi:hypothetical protein
MTKGKQWSAQEEAELKSLVEANTRIDEISIKLQKTPGAIFLKCKRLGIELKAKGYANTSIPIPRELPSVEETAKILAGALRLATQPGLDKIEVQRLQTVAAITKIYKEHLADYINYRQIEAKLREMEELNARLLRERSQSSSSQPDSSQVV